MRFWLIFTALSSFLSPLFAQKDWCLGPFERPLAENPVLSPGTESFACPMRQQVIGWRSNHVLNPAAVVRDGKVYLLFRAEDTTGVAQIGGHTSRIGLAESTDGLHFTVHPQPVLYPDNDAQKPTEWDGGCEDPRIVESSDGTYVMTYTQWNRQLARLAVATSRDLVHWQKHGPVFAQAHNGRWNNQWSKSGSIVCRQKGSRLVAAKIKGKYWMYWGEGHIQLATSTDLIHWEPVLNPDGSLFSVFTTRPGKFDSDLVEPGPPAVLTRRGIVFLYNSKNSATKGDPALPANTYAAGQVLLDAREPGRLIDRTDNYFIRPELPFERTGQYVAGTVFLEGLVYFKKRWFLYYGTADSKVAVAVQQQ